MDDLGLAALAETIAALAPYDGTVELRVPGVRAARVSRTSREHVHYVQRSSVCIVAQGAKIVMIGADTYSYEAGQMALYSIDVAMAGRVTRASPSEPYLLLMNDLDAEKVAELAMRVFLTACRSRETPARSTSGRLTRTSSMRRRGCSS
jgi:hypothetical protein